MFAITDRWRQTARDRARRLQIERLECRRMLAGDVQLLTETGPLANAAVDTPVAYVATVAESLFFQRELAGLDDTLWVADGTQLGTRSLDIDLDGKQILGGADFHGSLLLVIATSNTSGYTATLELWTVPLSDSSASKIVEVPNVQVPINGAFEIVVAGDYAYFPVDTEAAGSELWKSDATGPGTGLTTEIAAGNLGASPESLTAVGDELFFTAKDGLAGRQVWWTDGSDLQRITDGGFSFQGIGERREQFVAGPGFLAFSARTTSAAPFSLWTTSGPLDPPTTPRIADLGWDFSSDFPRRLAANNHGAFIVKQTSPSATELWATETGQTVTRTGTFDFWVSALVATEQLAFFLDRTETDGTTLWVSDTDVATEATTLAHNLTSSSEHVGQLLALPTRVAFSYDDLDWPGLHGNELWLSDGTTDGTFMPRDLHPGRSGSGLPLGSDPHRLIASTDYLFFQADDGTHGVELFSVPVGLQQRNLVATLDDPTSITASGTGSQWITVTYETDDGQIGIDSDTLDDNDLRLIGPGVSQGLLMSRSPGPQPGPTDGSYRVDYQLKPPAIVWRPEHNGVYTVHLEDNQVQDTAGTFVPGGDLAVFAVAIPTAEWAGADDVTTDGQTETIIEVRYEDYVDDVEWVDGSIVQHTGNVGIDVSSLDASDLRVTDSTGNPFGSLEFVDSLPAFDDSPVTATYRLVPEGGEWDVTEDGSYHVYLEDSQVVDIDGHAVASEMRLGSFDVRIADVVPPTASFTAATDVRSVGTGAELDVRYHDDVAIDQNSLDDADLMILDGRGVAIENVDLELASITTDPGVDSVLATYRLVSSDPPLVRPAPGSYTIHLLPNALFDSSGNGNEGRELGTFTVGWTNSANRFDVNGSGGDASPTDALAVLNELSDFVWADSEDGSLPFVSNGIDRYFDVNGDGYVSPTDALSVLVRLNELNGVSSVPVSGAARVADVSPVAHVLTATDLDAVADRDALTGGVAGWKEEYGIIRPADQWYLTVDQLFAEDRFDLRLRRRPLRETCAERCGNCE